MNDLAESPYRGRMPKVWLMGEIGAGKSNALRTIVEAGLELCTIETEPSETLDDVPCSRGLHRRFVMPVVSGWDAMIQMAEYINSMSFKGLTDLIDPNKRSYRGWFDVLSACANYKCDRCGKVLGDITKFHSRQALALDSLSGLNIMAMELQAGAKPVKAQGDWQIAMDNLERFIIKLATDTRCLLVVTSHIEREIDEITGGHSMYPGTLGRKLAPKIPRFFSDVIHARKESRRWLWSTETPGFHLKSRNVGWGEKLEADFRPLLRTYDERFAKGLVPEGTDV